MQLKKYRINVTVLCQEKKNTNTYLVVFPHMFLRLASLQSSLSHSLNHLALREVTSVI